MFKQFFSVFAVMILLGCSTSDVFAEGESYVTYVPGYDPNKCYGCVSRHMGSQATAFGIHDGCKCDNTTAHDVNTVWAYCESVCGTFDLCQATYCEAADNQNLCSDSCDHCVH